MPSQTTVKLVTGAFDELAKDPSIGGAEVLRRAEMAMLDPENPPEFAHPMMWAPFLLVGEGGLGDSLIRAPERMIGCCRNGRAPASRAGWSTDP